MFVNLKLVWLQAALDQSRYFTYQCTFIDKIQTIIAPKKWTVSIENCYVSCNQYHKSFSPYSVNTREWRNYIVKYWIIFLPYSKEVYKVNKHFYDLLSLQSTENKLLYICGISSSVRIFTLYRREVKLNKIVHNFVTIFSVTLIIFTKGAHEAKTTNINACTCINCTPVDSTLPPGPCPHSL